MIVIFPLLGINDISKNKDDDLNELPISVYKDRETIIDHSFSINEHEIFIPHFDTLDEIEENSRKYIIYDNYCDIEDIDFYLHDAIQITSKNEEHFNLEIIPTNPHSRAANYLHNLTIRENIPIYDSYHDQALIPNHNNNYLSNSQDGIGN